MVFKIFGLHFILVNLSPRKTLIEHDPYSLHNDLVRFSFFFGIKSFHKSCSSYLLITPKRGSQESILTKLQPIPTLLSVMLR